MINSTALSFDLRMQIFSYSLNRCFGTVSYHSDFSKQINDRVIVVLFDIVTETHYIIHNSCGCTLVLLIPVSAGIPGQLSP